MARSAQAITIPASLEMPSGPRQDREHFQWGSLLLLLPSVLLLAGLFLFPVGYAFYLGFTNLALIGPTAQNFQFTGAANLQTLVHDSVFYQSLVLTFIFVFGSGVVGVTVLGLLLALLMQHAVGVIRAIVGSIVIVSWMLPPVTAALIWYAFSTANGTMAVLALNPKADYLHTAPMLMVCLANIWATAGFAMIVLSAGLRNVPAEIIEASQVEGARIWHRFWSITLPIMWPTIVTTVLLVGLLTLANFSLVYIMTAGGPGNSTNILPVYSYQQAFSFDHLAYGALLGDVMVVIATILAFAYVRVARVTI
ncbi:MAG TPA: sugar ABC transporter permease [Chloroflexota bacterium]